MNGDIPTSQIVAIHEPWHTAYHMIKEDPRHLEETKSGGNDWMIDHPDFGKNYGTAVEKIKSEGALHTAVNGPDEVPASHDPEFDKSMEIKKESSMRYEDLMEGLLREAKESLPSESWGSPIHPGYSNTGIENHRATHFEDLPPERQQAVRDHFEKTVPGLTEDKMVSNIKEVTRRGLSGGDKEKLGWYHEAHGEVADMAHEHGHTGRAMAGATAALSAGTSWDSNITMARYYAHHLSPKRPDNTLRLDVDKLPNERPKVLPGKTATEPISPRELADKHGLKHGMRFSDMSHEQAHAALTLQGAHTDKITNAYGGKMIEEPHKPPSWQSASNGTKAVRILRGEDPSKVLGGHKIRSFFNNLAFPGKTDDVTVDTHSASIAAGGKMGTSSKTRAQLLEVLNNKKVNSKDGYGYIAHAYRRAHRELQDEGDMPKDSAPADTQAVSWSKWRKIMPAKLKKGVDVPLSQVCGHPRWRGLRGTFGPLWWS